MMNNMEMLNDMELEMAAGGGILDKILNAYSDVMYEAASCGLLGIAAYLAVAGREEQTVFHDETGAWGSW